MTSRVEKDLLGEKTIPAGVYWGIHTQRALDNFRITDYRTDPELIKALAIVKKACCLASCELGFIESEKAAAIVAACDEIMEGKWLDQFPLDALQGGAGTSLNMNMNEVLANRALAMLNKETGRYDVLHPIEDVNLHQSTNDVYPTAVKIACIAHLRALSAAVAEVQGVFQKKEKEFASIVKLGRTELQEAVPMTLGSEFSAFAEAIARDRWRTFKCEERIRTVNLGGTAVGTGLTAPRSYIFLVIEKLREITGLGLARAENLVDHTANTDPFVEISGILQAHASNLIKISNDLRILNLLGEIALPKVQTGSSIMPGKVNPVICEATIQAGLKVMANHSLVCESASRGTLQINEFLPILSFAILESLRILINTNGMFRSYVAGIQASPENCENYINRSPAIITALLPHIGYDKATELVRDFSKSGKGNLKNYLVQNLGKELVEKVLSPLNLTSLGYRTDEEGT